ncbi:hypothetical protein MPH_12005 [Macrophomina phaseolina MS6]|uniref:Zn(2)-C6 fungal-type domain-containing protein n=1 Tax=Macrophomina phaseolina (strain MS6) TaxID=1126212 RepID=K2RDK7_MACPH|nr:hypothetical protein MPH_12005 [Macrophomina phaseolina MS6]
MLLRLADTGNRSSNCPLCNRAFARSDVARRHVKACAIKQNRPLPPQRRRGTPRQACDNCARAKIACDRSPVCSSCRSHSLTCSYNRINRPDSAFSAPPLDNSGRSDSEKLSVSFLLSFTDPRTPASSDLIVSQSLLEPLSSHASTSDYFVLQDDEVVPEGYLNGCNGLLSKFSLGFWDEDDGASAAECRPQPQAEPCLSALTKRAEELISELASFHHKLCQFDPPNAPFFDRMQARQVFTATNLKKLIYASFIPFSRHLALLHWPSFDPGTVALPLVLAVFMLGSVFSVPTDDALSARQFLNISEEYIFRASSLQSLIRGESQLATFRYQIMLEHVQAALLICSTQLSPNNRQTRRRIRMQRHPVAVAAVRSLLSIKMERPAHSQSAYSEWQAFLVSELRVRLLYVAFVNDAMLTMHFNHAPLITLTELNGPLPCVDALFEAENAKVYSNIRAEAAAAGNPPSSLAALVELLMKDNWTPADDIKLEGLTIRHLMGAVAGSSITFTSAL